MLKLIVGHVEVVVESYRNGVLLKSMSLVEVADVSCLNWSIKGPSLNP